MLQNLALLSVNFVGVKSCIRHFILLILLLQIGGCGIFKKKSKRIDKTPIPTSKTSNNKDLLKKYTQIVGVNVENEKLYSFIDNWIGVPYKYGGKNKSGIDCSNFTCETLRSVFSFSPSFYQPSSKLAEQGKRIEKEDVKEGDLVFFFINQNSKISHVGIYLDNNKFVHASTSKGVIISSLEEDYYKKRFAFFKRLSK